jgi:hypothetical protein
MRGIIGRARMGFEWGWGEEAGDWVGLGSWLERLDGYARCIPSDSHLGAAPLSAITGRGRGGAMLESIFRFV